jgi:hypothetical protein
MLTNRLMPLIVLLCLSFGNLYAQDSSNKILIEEYIKQSENQKKTGLIMLGAGLGATLIGTVMFGSAWSTGSEVVGVSGAILVTAGVISTLVSIPIIISSASKARKAGQLSLDLNTARVLTPGGNSPSIYPGLKLSVPLNSAKR